MSTTFLNGEPDNSGRKEMRDYMLNVRRLRERIEADRINGEDALRRLLPVALGNTGQSRRVALVLLGCYNGYRFPLDLTNLRSIDYPLMEDCLAVLRMDANPYQEVHTYFENGSAIFEQMAKDWNIEKSGDV